MRSLAWYARRLSAMSPAEVLYRTGQMGRKQLRRLHSGVPRSVSEPTIRTHAPSLRLRFFDLDLPYPSPALPIDWSRDYKNGVSAPRVFYGGLDYRDEAQVGDSKYTWELNRHQFLAPWALEYRGTGEEAWASGVAHLIVDWIAQNPRHVGINWTSSLELALRILSWGIALDLCSSSSAIAAARPTIVDSVGEQIAYVRHTLSLYSSANNHLMGELIGLLAAGVFFPEAQGARKHAEFARERLWKEALRQNLADGVNREQAVYYHHYTLEYVLTAVALCERLGLEAPAPVLARARRMLEFVDSMVDDAGEAFEVGDRDDGAVTGLNLGTGVGVYESLLWSGHLRFGDSGFLAHAAAIARAHGRVATPDPKTRYWLGGRQAGPVDDATRVRRRVFREGGYFVSTDEEWTLLFKAGPFGYPSIAAHSHCDQLSVGLKRGARTVLTDPGTYVYHTEERWRRHFRGTSAHNTVGVDGMDQAEYAGSFLWSSHANGRLDVIDDSPDRFALRGSHDGYRRLADPVDHERRVEYRRGVGYRILDRLRARGPHRFGLYWNFGWEVEVEPLDDPRPERSAAFAVRLGEEAVLGMLVEADTSFDLRTLSGDETEPAGFESRAYLDRRPSAHLRATVQVPAVDFRTFFVTARPFRAAEIRAAAGEWA